MVLIGLFCCAGFFAMLIGALLLCLLGSLVVPIRLFCCANGVYLQCPPLHLDHVVSVLWGSEYNPASAWWECLSATYFITLHHTATRCNTLQHTATHCKASTCQECLMEQVLVPSSMSTHSGHRHRQLQKTLTAVIDKKWG